MPFDIESIGSGAGAGLIGAVLAVLGINRRMKKVEDDKQDKSVCEVLHKSSDEKFERIIKGQDKLFEKVENLDNYLRNHKP